LHEKAVALPTIVVALPPLNNDNSLTSVQKFFYSKLSDFCEDNNKL
jgi:hypothetical protein